MTHVLGHLQHHAIAQHLGLSCGIMWRNLLRHLESALLVKGITNDELYALRLQLILRSYTYLSALGVGVLQLLGIQRHKGINGVLPRAEHLFAIGSTVVAGQRSPEVGLQSTAISKHGVPKDIVTREPTRGLVERHRAHIVCYRDDVLPTLQLQFAGVSVGHIGHRQRVGLKWAHHDLCLGYRLTFVNEGRGHRLMIGNIEGKLACGIGLEQVCIT